MSARRSRAAHAPAPLWAQIALPLLAVGGSTLVVAGLQDRYPTGSEFLFVHVLPVAGAAYVVGRPGGLFAALLAIVSALSVNPTLRRGAVEDLWPAQALFALVALASAALGAHLRWTADERSRLFSAARRRARQQEAVARLGHLALRSRSLQTVLDDAVLAIRDTLDPDVVEVLEVLPGGRLLLLRAASGWPGDRVGRDQVSTSPHLLPGFTLESGGPVTVLDFRREERCAVPTLLHQHGITSSLCVPVYGADRPFGVLGVHSRSPRVFGQDDVHFMQAMANVLSAAIARRYADEVVRESEERMRIALEAGGFGAWDWDVRSGDVSWSAALETLHGLAPGTFGGTFDDFRRDIHPEDRERVLRAVERAVAGGAPYDIEYRIVRPDGEVRWLAARGVVLRDDRGQALRMIGVCADVTGRRQVEEEREVLLAQERRARAEAEEARTRLAFLADSSTALASPLEYAETLANLAEVAVPRFADWFAVDLLTDEGTLETVAIKHADPRKLSLAREIRHLVPRDPSAPVGAYHVVRTGQPEFYPAIPEDLLAAVVSNPEALDLVRRLGLQSAIIVPLEARGRVLGTFAFVTAESGRRYTPADLGLAEELARRAALFIDNARLYEREHRIAVTLQRAFLPLDLPQPLGLRLDAAYQPAAREAAVGGDWYDAFRLPDGRLMLSIGDVAGHGLQAAVAMGQVRQAIRAAALEGEDPGSVVARASRVLALSESPAMATALVGVLEPASRRFSFASAGHPAPILATPDGEVVALGAGGMPLGVPVRFGVPAVREVTLPRGALLALYTDGLVEYDRDPSQGEARLIEVVRDEVRLPSRSPALSILRRTLEDRQGRDDVAVLTVNVAPTPIDALDLVLPAIPSALPLIRQAVEQLGEAAGLPADRRVWLQIAVGEAVNNSIEHAYILEPGQVRLRAWRQQDGAVVVDVEDQGRWRAPRASGGGRGLKIMRALTDWVSVTSADRGTSVRIVLRDGSTLAGEPL